MRWSCFAASGAATLHKVDGIIKVESFEFFNFTSNQLLTKYQAESMDVLEPVYLHIKINKYEINLLCKYPYN